MIAFEIFVQGVELEPDLGIGNVWLLIPFIWILFWGWTGLVLAREITFWRRGLQSQSTAPISTPAS